MKLKRNAPRPGLSTRLVRAGIAGLVSIAAVAGLAAGCLDRPICPDPAHPDACSPAVKNVFVTNLTQSSVDKIDLLFMIDNSASMADKQILLSQAVPQLVSRLVNPICVDPKTGAKVADPPANPDDACTTGEREFSAIKDIHIGVVTSSLGGHGSPICTPDWTGSWNATEDDKGHLIPNAPSATDPNVDAKRHGIPNYNSEGFLAWDPTGTKNTPPGETNVGNLITQFTQMVTATGETGCGYEASLEGWYRFLVDPNPPDKVSFDAAHQQTVETGTDQELLTERKNFLRSDSLVSIIMLTDENDCSVQDAGLGWLVGFGIKDGSHLPAASSKCAQNPNDPCCFSCGQNGAPPNHCAPDPACNGATGTLNGTSDSLNLRCFDQKRRFGVDLLYPTARYANALSKTIICPQTPDLSCPNGGGVPNPLYSDLSNSGRAIRGPDLVFLAGIVGVPWQDIATADTLKDPNKLKYLTAAELATSDPNTNKTRWDVILGDPENYVDPLDPLMKESPSPRTGANPITGDALAPPTAGPKANPINGHEYTDADNSDLEYACIFPLATPKDCTTATSCDCSASGSGDKPLCQDPNTGTTSTTTQYFAKGYPGLRELDVLKQYGANSIVASICPKIQDSTNADFGYNPAVAAIIDRLKSALNGKCLPRLLDVDPTTGEVPCAVVEALSPTQAKSIGNAACNRSGRIDLGTQSNGDLISKAVKSQLKALGQCDVPNAPACDSYLLCEINQFSGSTDPQGLAACQNQDPFQYNASGYCYVADNAQNQHIGNPDLLSKCPDTQKQLLRFVGNDSKYPLPAAGASYFIACTGAAFATGGTSTPAPDGG